MEKLIRPELAAFGGYSAATSPEILEGKVEVPVESIIKLDANENPYGCSPRVSRALANYKNFNIYPDDGQTRLRKLLAGYAGVDAGHIVAGSGSNQLIDLLLRIFLNRGDEVISCVPTFGIYRFSTELCGGTLVEVLRDADFAVDVAKVKAAITKRTKMIILTNPNNPTGTVIPPSHIMEIMGAGLPLLIDEAYYEFSGQTVSPLVSRYPNLMVLRTLSKWAGLAGLRVGYGLFPPKIAAYLLRTKIPYNVNVAALVAVEESLQDIDYLLGNVKSIIGERERLFRELARINWLKPFPSQANFILCQVLKGEARKVWQKLQDKGVLVRYFDEPLVRNYIRISVGKPEHTDALIKALKELKK
ncbi:MAG: histidinol-phosphate transaminase [Chloroflexi bacterium]|nr:histidinol-phosphate transaminase [Chloroflexota bacterium]MBI2980399.1 histidinol-phosphate transaminase [Chloroflexota bacterium]